MKTKFYSLILLGMIFDPSFSFAVPRQVTLREITQKVTTENYMVLQNAQRVYQAKEAIQLARRNLLPRLNLWRIIEAPTNPLSLLGLVEDIAPFLVPSNWLRVREEENFAQASDYAYRSLWANEVMSARGLFYQASLENQLHQELDKNREDLDFVWQITRARETMGAVPSGSSAQVEIHQYSLNEELRIIRNVIHENQTQLAFILGMPGSDEATPIGVQYLSPTGIPPLRYEDHETLLLNSSYEVKEFDALIEASRHVEDERYFSFLGTSSQSRGGLFGGIFDSLPYQDGLGFGLGPSVRIVGSQRRILRLQKESVQETLRRNLRVLVESYNLDLEFRANAVNRVRIAEQYWGSLLERMRLGEMIDSLVLVDASRSRVEAASAYHALETRLLLSRDRLKRLTYQEDYQNAHGRLR